MAIVVVVTVIIVGDRCKYNPNDNDGDDKDEDGGNRDGIKDNGDVSLYWYFMVTDGYYFAYLNVKKNFNKKV